MPTPMLIVLCILTVLIISKSQIFPTKFRRKKREPFIYKGSRGYFCHGVSSDILCGAKFDILCITAGVTFQMLLASIKCQFY